MGVRFANRLSQEPRIALHRNNQNATPTTAFRVGARIAATVAMMTVATVAATSASAQALTVSSNNSATTSALRLHIVNDNDAPVPLAEVTVRQGRRRATGRTDSTGVFRAEGLSAGDWQASVRRIGYNEAIIDMHVVNGDNVFTITVDPVSATLKGMDIVEKRFISTRLSDFESRRVRGEPNAVITRDQIDKRNPIYLSQMLRGLPGINVADESGARIPVASRGNIPKFAESPPTRGAERQSVPTMAACPMRVAVDGVMRPPLSNLDDVNPVEVHGVEVYYGPARLPLQLANLRTDNWCGLVMIWTRER